jgi:hypothetical protein
MQLEVRALPDGDLCEAFPLSPATEHFTEEDFANRGDSLVVVSRDNRCVAYSNDQTLLNTARLTPVI